MTIKVWRCLASEVRTFVMFKHIRACVFVRVCERVLSEMRAYLVRCRLSSCTGISTLLKSFNSFRIDA